MSTTTTVTEAQPVITAENMLRLFPDIDTRSDALTGHDAEQIRLMDEVCIVTDDNDMPIGTASKKICTSNTYVRGTQSQKRKSSSRRPGLFVQHSNKANAPP
jgi:hypothetical protein